MTSRLVFLVFLLLADSPAQAEDRTQVFFDIWSKTCGSHPADVASVESVMGQEGFKGGVITPFFFSWMGMTSYAWQGPAEFPGSDLSYAELPRGARTCFLTMSGIDRKAFFNELNNRIQAGTAFSISAGNQFDSGTISLNSSNAGDSITVMTTYGGLK